MDQELADLFALLNGKWDPALQDHVIVARPRHDAVEI